MNELILSQNNELTMSSREIAKITSKEHGHVMRDIRKMLDEIGVEQNPFLDSDKTGFNGKELRFFVLNKNLTMTLVAGYNAKLRFNIIERWQELESKQAFKIPQTLGEALQLAADQAKQLELQAPKVAFIDSCVERGQLMTATQVAQKHKLSAVRLNKFLDELGGVYSKSVKRSRAFVQPFVDDGLGEMKQTELGYSQALFTTKGEQWINEKLINEGVI